MKYWLMIIAIAILPHLAQAAEDNYSFDDPKQRETFLRLTAELRCPMCQNQNIADSDAMIAHDMRRKVYQLLQEGNTEQEVVEFMKTRYGDFVSYQPPVTPVTMWLWVLPIGFAIVALIVVVRRKKVAPVQDMAAKLAEAERLLEQDK